MSADALPASLVKPLAAEARGLTESLGDPAVKTAQVYGPDSRSALVQASSGDLIPRTGDRKGFYLVVVHGHFVCGNCSRPAADAKPIQGTIATSVWSVKAGHSMDFGLSHTLHAMSRLGRPAVISLG
jgi:hypothetical protein